MNAILLKKWRFYFRNFLNSSKFEAFLSLATSKLKISKKKLFYLCIEESFDTTFNMRYNAKSWFKELSVTSFEVSLIFFNIGRVYNKAKIGFFVCFQKKNTKKLRRSKSLLSSNETAKTERLSLSLILSFSLSLSPTFSLSF